MVHSLEHSKNSFESIVKSRPVKIAVGLAGAAEAVATGVQKIVCFDGNTKIDLMYDEVAIKDVKVGDLLKNNDIILAKHKFLNCEELYNYSGG